MGGIFKVDPRPNAALELELLNEEGMPIGNELQREQAKTQCPCHFGYADVEHTTRSGNMAAIKARQRAHAVRLKPLWIKLAPLLLHPKPARQRAW